MYAERLLKIRAGTKLTGIDYVTVLPDQMTLNVVLVRTVGGMVPDFEIPPFDKISIVSTTGGESVPVVRVNGASVVTPVGSPSILILTLDTPGDFSLYRLTIDDPQFDILFRSVTFSFKANCPDADIDCKPVQEPCAPEPSVDFPVDYMARDFLSLRGVLLAYAAQRYPQWRETIPADAGVMLLELLAALGDELSYTQDRIAREAYLATATQRRSLRRHGHLVDYNIHDGRSGSTWLDVQVKDIGDPPITEAELSPHTRVWAVSDDGETIPFETGEGLADSASFTAVKAWNSLPAHYFDPEQTLPAGTTELWIEATAIIIPDPEGTWNDKWVLIHSEPTDPTKPRRRHLVKILSATPDVDNIPPADDDEPYDDEPVALVHLVWDASQALPFCLDFDGLTVHGNMVRATAGERRTATIQIHGADPLALQAVEREGPLDSTTGERSVTFLCSLPDAEAEGLAWLGSDLRNTKPEVLLNNDYIWRRTLLESTDLDRHYTLEDGTWRRVIGFQRPTVDQDFVHVDYAADAGYTIRFGGDGFGISPADGTTFACTYRTGPGSRSNVAADTIVQLNHPVTGETDAPVDDLTDEILVTVTNPLPVTDGVDPETREEVRQLAPEEFRAVIHRAVAPVDYCTIAERLEWVQYAGARFRWTGSWQTGFVTPDPEDSFRVTADQHTELVDLMNCVRQAGREVHVLDPRYRPIDLEVTVCVKQGHLPSEVRDRVTFRLRGDGTNPGYFSPDNFTFGTPIQRLTLEAIIGAVPGVLGVRSIRIGARNVHALRSLDPVYIVGTNEILRLANDPRTPERGSLKVYTEGGV